MAIRRAFALIDDPTLGGSSLDTLRTDPDDPTETPDIPDPDTLLKVTDVTVDKGQTNLTRDNEVNNQIGSQPPEEFRQAPMVTVTGRLYMPLLKKFVKALCSTTPTSTGTAPASITKGYRPVSTGATGLNAFHLAVVRDDLYEKFAGAQLGQLSLTFGNDEDATFQAVFGCLYRAQETEELPDIAVSANYSPDWALKLRDAMLLLDGESDPMDGLAGFSLVVDNALRDPTDNNGSGFWAMRNRLRVAATANDRERVVWFPAQRKLGSRRTITGTLNFSSVDAAQETKQDLLRAEQAVFEVEGGPIATTPAARQMFRATLPKMVRTGGGASDLSADDDITTQYDIGGYLDTSGHDLLLEHTDTTG